MPVGGPGCRKPGPGRVPESDDRPVAVLELKGASRDYDDQLERCEAWA